MIISLAFLVFHVLFRTERIRKLNLNVSSIEGNEILKELNRNFKVSVICSMGCILSSITYTFLPVVNDLFISIEFLNINLIKYAGSFIIKISFVWIIVFGFQVSYNLDSSLERMPQGKINRIEMLSFVIVLLFCGGIFMFSPTLFSFLIFGLALVYTIILKKRNLIRIT